MGRKYSLSRAIKYHYSTCTSFFGFVIFLIASISILKFRVAVAGRLGYANLRIMTDYNESIIGIIFLIFSLLCLVWFISRIKIGKYFAKNGLETDAVIFNIIWQTLPRGEIRRRIEYSYEVNGNIYKWSCVIPKNQIAKINDIIKILVDPKDNRKNILVNHITKSTKKTPYPLCVLCVSAREK